MNNEEKNKKLIDDLKNLPKVNAPSDFDSQLWRKINSSEKKEKENFWDRLFSPGKLFPGAIAVTTAVLIFFIINAGSEEFEDPLNIEPRIREDLIVLDQYSDQALTESDKPLETPEGKSETKKKEIHTEELKDQPIQLDESREKPVLQNNLNKGVETEISAESPAAESLKIEQSQVAGKSLSPAPVSASSNEIKKDNLNFMQINLSVKERQQVEQLKQRIQATEKAKSE